MGDRNNPYMFISYSHKDESVVGEILRFLNRNSYRYWYDRGLLTGAEWSRELALRLSGASAFLLLLSRNSAESDWVKNEINFAITKKLPIFIIILDGFSPEEDCDILLMLGRRHMIKKNGREYENALLSAIPNNFCDSDDRAGRAPDTSDPAAQTVIGDGLYNEGRYDEAVSWYFRAASQGDPEAQYMMGLCSRSGIGTEKDSAAAARWFLMGAEQGHPQSQNMLGLCLYFGEGISSDLTEAVRLFKAAAEQNVIEAVNNLGVCYKTGRGTLRDMAEAMRLFEIAAIRGNADSQLEMGMYYYSLGNERDDSNAVQWFRMSAEQGNPAARYFLGLCHRDGRGVAQDAAEAGRLFRLAADAGEHRAQHELGLVSYTAGENGNAEAYAEALNWFNLSAEQGNVEAVCMLGVCYYYGKGTDTDYETAVKLFRIAAEAGHKNSMLNYAVCLENGLGVKKSVRDAKEWRKRAAKL